MTRFRLDCNSTAIHLPFTAILPRYDHSTTYVTSGLLHCGLRKQAVRVATQYAPAPPAVRTQRPTSSP